MLFVCGTDDQMWCNEGPPNMGPAGRPWEESSRPDLPPRSSNFQPQPMLRSRSEAPTATFGSESAPNKGRPSSCRKATGPHCNTSGSATDGNA
jgi:hypothetical protein